MSKEIVFDTAAQAAWQKIDTQRRISQREIAQAAWREAKQAGVVPEPGSASRWTTGPVFDQEAVSRWRTEDTARRAAQRAREIDGWKPVGNLPQSQPARPRP